MKNLKITRGVFYPLEIEVILEVLRDDLRIEEAGNGHFALSGSAEHANIGSIIEFDIGDGMPDNTLATAVYITTTYGRFICSFGCDGNINRHKVIYTILGIISQMCKPDFKLASAYKQALFSACENEPELLGVYNHVKDVFGKSQLPSIYAWKHQWADPNEDKLYFEE
ncbi:hypothetical protein IJN73_01840 [Candidatus Saccharibacteria bacterium]|nr:hypothetical protein [Candidatus Saccharibacteria bacterium]